MREFVEEGEDLTTFGVLAIDEDERRGRGMEGETAELAKIKGTMSVVSTME